MREVTWERMRYRMWARVAQTKKALADSSEWAFRYYNDVPILLNEIDRLRKLKR